MAYNGPLPQVVKAGGTGAATLTSNQLLLGNGTSAVTQIAYQSTGGTYGGTSNIAARDSNGNTSHNNTIDGQTSNAAGGTTTLTVASTRSQIFSGVGASTLVLPDATTLIAGWTFYINNNSNSAITVQYHDTTTLLSIPSSAYTQLFLTSAGSTNGTWDYHWLLPSSLTNGQLIIGSTASGPSAATLTAGSGISITNGSNSITVSSSGSGLAWTDVTGATQTIAASNGYLADRAGGVAFTLPASGTIGDVFRIVGVQGSWTVAQAAGQQIKFGSAATTAGVTGSLASTNAGDCLECVATNTSASTIWRVMSSVGNITVV